MAFATLPATEYAVTEARQCAECTNTLPDDAPGQRRLCDRCRHINRGLKYLRAASASFDAAGNPGAVGVIEVLVGQVGPDR